MSTKHALTSKSGCGFIPARSILAFSLLGAALCPTSIFALGMRLADQDPFATARGNAFVATADDPSAVYYNAAGITQLPGQNFSVGIYGITYGSEFKPAHGGGTVDSKQQWAALPQIYYTFSMEKIPLSLGLGVYSPYGLSTEWPGNAPFVGGSGAFPSKASIDYLTVNPVIAYKPVKTLSIAAGPTFNFAQADLDTEPFGVPANSLHFRGSGVSYGFNAGILWQPCPKHSFGINYHSASDMTFSGHAKGVFPLFHVNGTTSTSGTFKFPQDIVFGYSFRPTPKWNFEFDADWTDWRGQTVTLASTPLGPQAIPFNWQSSWFFEFGATRYFGDNWQVSAGYIYSENSVPDNSFNPVVPDSDRHIFSIGVGKKYKRVSWNIAYQLAYGPTRTVSSLVGAGGPATANGNYDFLSQALAINLGYHF